MQLIDEQDDLSLGLDHLVAHRLQPLFELTAHLGPGHDLSHVQGQQALVEQGVRHVRIGDALGKALDDHRLAHAGLADQGRIVLLAPRQGLNDAGYLLLSADHRIQLPAPGHLREVAGVALQHVRLGLGILAVDRPPAADLLQRLACLLLVDARLAQKLRGVAGFGVEQGDEQGAGGDEAVAEFLGLLVGNAEELRHLLGRDDLRGLDRSCMLILLADALLDALDGVAWVCEQVLQDAHGLCIGL